MNHPPTRVRFALGPVGAPSREVVFRLLAYRPMDNLRCWSALYKNENLNRAARSTTKRGFSADRHFVCDLDDQTMSVRPGATVESETGGIDMTEKTMALDSDLANRDPLSGAPGSHPVGTGIGSAGGAAAGAAIGGAVGGPAGVLVGGAIGAVAGGVTGHAAGESANPTVEHEPPPEVQESSLPPGRKSILGL